MIVAGTLFACAVSAIALLSVLVLSLDGFDGTPGTDLGSGLEYGSGSGSGYF